MNFRQANLPLGLRLRECRGARQPRKQGFEIEPPIEAVLELGQIPLSVFLEFKRVIGAEKVNEYGARVAKIMNEKPWTKQGCTA